MDPGTNGIVLLLESPHKHEYCRGINDPIAPARGPTGDNICTYLGEVLEQIEQQQVLECGDDVTISNPIQFQTSLSTIHGRSLSGKGSSPWKRLRNAVWTTLWEENYIKQDFLLRLCHYNPKIIINACTSFFISIHSPSPREKVTDLIRLQDQDMDNINPPCTEAILHNLTNLPLYECGHPFGWSINEENRQVFRIPAGQEYVDWVTAGRPRQP